MSGLTSIMSFGAGAFCLGCAFIISLIFTMAARSSGDRAEGCIAKFIALTGLLLAAIFFYLAVTA